MALTKFGAGKIPSPLHLPLKLEAVFKKQRAFFKVSLHLQEQVKQLSEIFEIYEIS